MVVQLAHSHLTHTHTLTRGEIQEIEHTRASLAEVRREGIIGRQCDPSKRRTQFRNKKSTKACASTRTSLAHVCFWLCCSCVKDADALVEKSEQLWSKCYLGDASVQ